MEVEKLRVQLESLEKQTGTDSLTNSSMSSTSQELNVSDKFLKNSWILDSGAGDHITNAFKYFCTYVPCSSNKNIITADGSLITVAGQGDIKLSPTLILKNVLHVPKLCVNLVSVSKLSQDSNCKVIFDSSHCDFEDRNSGEIIGHAEARNGLYYLDAYEGSFSTITTNFTNKI